ncbi:hypothetical protein U1Q18_025415 [Sarracenia purpurea var. burkii]
MVEVFLEGYLSTIADRHTSWNRRLAGMEDHVAQNVDASDPKWGETYTHDGVTFDYKDEREIGIAMEALTRVDLDLAYSSEKSVNL